VGENVFGLVTWNAGMVFEEVCADLESEGYFVQPFVLPAAAVDAPHRRDRVWFVAYNPDARTEGLRSGRQNTFHGLKIATDAKSNRLELDWQDFPTQPPICSGDDGFSTELDGITFSKWRGESIKGYGNAIVPQVAMQIFRAIQAYEQQ
jgi:DNA (cytosine-5)-methyltransferase 1